MALHEDDKIKSKAYDTTNAKNLDIIIKGILQKWWLILVIALLAGLIGIYYASKQKVFYQSRLTFALDEGEGGGISSAISLAAQFGLSIGSGKEVFAGDNIIEIMKSRRIIESTLLSIDTFDKKPFTFVEYFLNQQEKKNPKARSIHFPVDQSQSTFSYAQDSLLYECYLQFAKSYISCEKPDRKYNIYEVSVKNENEKFAKDFTDRIVAETNRFYTTISTKKAKQTLDILEQRVANMKSSVNSSIGTRAEVQDMNLNPVFSEAQVPVLKEQTNIQVYGGAYAEMFKNLEIARYQYLKQIPLMQIIDPADYPMKKVKTGKLKTAVMFFFIGGFLTIFVLWIINLFGLKTDKFEE
jgi:uncharacterized protein involved in exopolysaccharide biosynthesis